jgi:predicted anti-sigma-YlaC factor YlaD
MRCEEFRDRLDAIVARTLDAADSARADAHEQGCAACNALLRVATGEENPLQRTAADALAGRVLRGTIGTSQCSGARQRLCEHMDVPPDPIDAQLVAMHLEHCSACTAVASALAALRIDVPTLATWSPDAAFVTDVLLATSRRPQAAWAASWRRRWQRLLQRPRLAWELAYGATLIVALLAGPPTAPLHRVPRQALALVQVDPQAFVAASVRVGTRAVDFGQSLWDATGGELQARARAEVAAFGTTHPQLHVAWKDLQRHVVELGRGMGAADIGRITRALEQIGTDLLALGRGLLHRGAQSA